jgi:uncharacterized protein
MLNPLRNNPALGRFAFDLDGGLAIAQYRLSPGIITIVHTEIPPGLRGQGVGSTLVRRLLEEFRAQGLKVVAQCGFVRAFVASHPEFKDLLR